jgi:hypothetical protein
LIKSSFVGKWFVTTEHYHTPSGVRPEGCSGNVLTEVGTDSYLIRHWYEKEWRQTVVPASFFIEASARIYDTFTELKVANAKAKGIQ